MAASADDRTIDAEDPQDAAETYAAQRGLREPTRVWVREPGAPAWSMWTVEPVTTYRARHLVGAIRRMGERTGAAAERILDDLDTLLAENARLRAVAEAAREYRAMEAPGLDMCRDNARDVLDEAIEALEAP